MGKEKIDYLQQNGNETKNKEYNGSQWTIVNNVLKENNNQLRILKLAKIPPFKNKTKNRHFKADKIERQSLVDPH